MKAGSDGEPGRYVGQPHWTSSADPDSYQWSSRSEPERPVSFLFMPSFAGALDLGSRTSITKDISDGGAWYCMVNTERIGPPGGLSKSDFAQYDEITRRTRYGMGPL